MIRYDIDFAELEAAVDEASPTWRTRAAKAVERMQASSPREYDPSGPSWSEIKSVYSQRQHNKCAYCERQLEADDYGSIEHDVEHYRPRCAVNPWPAPGYRFAVRDGNPRGYCMLAHDLRNYCVACKTCNSALKRTYFPIAGHRGSSNARNIARLNRRERPFLIYPLGRVDEDPEELVTFHGINPVPKPRRGHHRHRARVTIDLLRLSERDQLLRERALMIREIGRILRDICDDGRSEGQRRQAREDLESLLDGSEPHTSCARSFVELFRVDPARAVAVYEAAREHLRRTS